MADVITRFKLETTQFDSKLRDTSKSLAELTHHYSLAGKDFDKFSKNSVEFARTLGTVASGATNAKDKVKDLVWAFNTVAKAYNSLSKEAQQTDYGKAIAESLVKLKGDITEAKKELYSMGDSGKSTGGIMDQLASKFTVNIDAMKLFDLGLKAAKGALNVVKDAFFASEAHVDDWGRTMQAAQGLYQGFLNALNTGDISGYLDRMSDIVKAAQEAYNEMDKLGTMKTIQGPQKSFQQTENERIRMMIQTGRYIAPRDGRLTTSTMKEGDLLSPQQIRAFEGLLNSGMNRMVDLVGNEIKQTNKAIDAYYNSLAKQSGISLSEFRQGTSSWSEFSKRQELARKYTEFERQHTFTTVQTGSMGTPIYTTVRDNVPNPHIQGRGWDVFRVDKQGENSLNGLVDLIKQRDQQVSQSYNMLSQSYRTINRAEGVTVRGLLNGKGGGGGNKPAKVKEILPTGSVAELTKQMSELRKEQSMVTDTASWQAYETQIKRVQMEMDILRGKVKLDDSGMGGYSFSKAIEKQLGNDKNALDTKVPYITGGIDFSKINEQIAEIQKNNKLEDVAKAGEKAAKSWKTAGSALSSFGSVLSSIPDPAARVAATVAQAIASVAFAYSDALAKTQAEKFNIWGFIAASAAAMVSMATTIAQIHSSTGYASGGVVGGTHYSGDMEWARLNAGETVLTAAQTNNVAANLQNSGSGFVLETKVSSDDLRIILKRGNMRRGYGSRNLVL